jgi:HSP20 family protein
LVTVRFAPNEEKENYRVMERRYGSFQRSLRLPDSVDEDKVEASFDNGVLKVRIPKRPEAVGKTAQDTNHKAIVANRKRLQA